MGASPVFLERLNNAVQREDTEVDPRMPAVKCRKSSYTLPDTREVPAAKRPPKDFWTPRACQRATTFGGLDILD